LIIPFTRTFDGKDGNPSPDNKLREDLKKELAGVLNRALVGRKRLALNNAFTQPKSVLEAKQAYIRNNDSMRLFLEECVVADTNGTIEKKAFRDLYKQWCDRRGVKRLHDAAIKEALVHGFPKLDEYREEKTRPWCWQGIAWSPDAADYQSCTLHGGAAQGDTDVPF
jgi:phage/plasmid-associated DNA primase